MCMPDKLSPAADLQTSSSSRITSHLQERTSSSSSRITSRQVFYSLASFCLGAWAFYKVNAISGPAFEPIVGACTNPDISVEDFAEKTGYHSYEAKLGLGAFNVLVCIITQFLLELRDTYPSGLLTWCGILMVACPLTLLNLVAAGRKGAKGPVRYPTIFGLLFQLFGVSVIYPMLWVPSYIISSKESKLGVPTTNLRIIYATILTLPGIILTFLVFSADTDSRVWSISAAILGGPIIAMSGLALWFDKSSSLVATIPNMTKSSDSIQKAYSLLSWLSFAMWACMVAIAYQTYASFGDMWSAIWVNAGPSVAFMTIDTIVLYLGMLIFIAYHSEKKALKALLLTPLLGPGSACSKAIKELERGATTEMIDEITQIRKSI